LYIKESAMDLGIFYELLGGDLPRGEVKAKMFAFHNSLVGKSRYINKPGNPRTACGSCIQRVKTSLWKFYHELPEDKKLSDLEFTGKFVAHNMPRYVRKEIA
jgi:hypothetical protein